jgi:predicted nucleic-acid-binding protein
LIKKSYNHHKALEFIEDLLFFSEIVDVNKKIILKSLKSNFNDFEDAIQNFSAELNSIKTLVTRNKKDYKNSNLYIYNPEEFSNHISN